MNSIDIFPWDDNFNTGLSEVDAQHRKLVQLLNLLASQVAFGADVVQLQAIFDELADYTVYHFRTEEGIWHTHFPGDPAEIEHQKVHANFVQTVLKLRAELASKSAAQTAEEALAFLVRWLASHILETDRHMAHIVLAMQSGMSMASARLYAIEQMGGATRTMIDIILSIYGTLSRNTLQLMRKISEQKRIEEELREAKQRAEAANLAKSQFLATMSHEIRTPLNGVLGMAQLLLMPDLDRAEQQEFARTIINSGNTLLALLNDVLDLSKIEAGKLELAYAAFDPVQLLDEVAALMVGNATRKGLALAAHWQGPTGRHYHGDPIRIRQMLGNLVSNAIKFSERGQIIVEASEVGGAGTDGPERARLRFTVSDTGIGIPADKIRHLFLPFSQVDASQTRRFGGTGLGLSIVRTLAECMDGEVGVDSEEGKGTRFWFELPLGVVQAGTDMRTTPRMPELGRSGAEAEAAPAGRILLVEDNAVNRLLVERVLQKQGFVVVVAEDGAQALEIFRREAATLDLVLMDLQMPVMDGLTATREIRAAEAGAGGHIPIIALTANVYEKDRAACTAAGMDDFLAKPINVHQLMQTIGTWRVRRA